jgi:uncharacterized protein YllA (UPF0747 family)
LIVSTIPWTRLDPGNALARDYLTDPGRALPLFAFDYRDPAALRPLVEAQRGRERPPLDLERYNAEVGGSESNARKIGRALCVISGQQVGLLYGPAYTTYKLFTVINAARVLSEELGEEVIPVFWIESEDHDFDEVNRFFWKGRRLRLDGEIPPGAAVSSIEADASSFLEQVRAEVGENEEAWALVRPESNLARWHARNLARLVAGTGVVFVEPGLLREPLRPLAERIAASPELIDASLAVETGYPHKLSPPNGGYLFDAGPPRVRLPRGAPLPPAWSTDVASRVLVQNAAFPVLAAVCGPSEIHYWAQLKGAHESFGIPMPAVLPRDAATLVDVGIARDAAKLGLDLEEVVRGLATEPDVSAEDPVAGRLRRLGGEVGQLFGALDDGGLDLPPNTEKPFRRTLERLGKDLDKLAGRIDDARAEAEGAGKRRFERVLRELRPRGGLQERTHSLFPYLVRHGPGLAERLRESFDPYEFGHYLVQL